MIWRYCCDFGHQSILQAAQRIPEERLPAFFGSAALEFVAAFQELRESVAIPIKPKAHAAHHDKPGPHPLASITGQLSLSHAVRVKSAEYWLRLGEADEVVRELEALPSRSWNHPSAIKARCDALEALQERTGAIVQI